MKRILKRGVLLAACLALCLLLPGCGKLKSEPLPEGMDEAAVIAAGEEVVQLLVDRQYQAVVDQFRPDIAENLTAQDVESLAQEALDRAGAFRRVEDSKTVGSSEVEPHGIAELFCEFSKKAVRFRIAFDPEMNLIGLDPPKVL